MYAPYPASLEARTLSFFGSQSCDHAAWLAERQLLAGDLESNPGPTPSLNPFYTHSLNTLIYQSNPLNSPHPHSPQPTHRLTHPPLQNTPTYHRSSIQLLGDRNLLGCWTPPQLHAGGMGRHNNMKKNIRTECAVIPQSVLTGDVNAHSTLLHSFTDDHSIR